MNAAQKRNTDRAYGRLLSRALPRAIRTDSQLDAMTAELLRLDELQEAGKATPAEQELAELLTTLIEKYEETHYPVSVKTPRHQNLAAIMEHRGIAQAEIAQIIGSRSLTSEILSGKREISKTVAKKLSEALRAPVELFL
jgi:HTH-type transcriptional regulator/antitoxin HigA